MTEKLNGRGALFYWVFNGITNHLFRKKFSPYTLRKMSYYYRSSLTPLYKPFMCKAPQGPFKVITDEAVRKQIEQIKGHLDVSLMPQASLRDKYLILVNIRKNYNAAHTVRELNAYFFDASMIWESVLSKPPHPKLRRTFWEEKYKDAFAHAQLACMALLNEE